VDVIAAQYELQLATAASAVEGAPSSGQESRKSVESSVKPDASFADTESAAPPSRSTIVLVSPPSRSPVLLAALPSRSPIVLASDSTSAEPAFCPHAVATQANQVTTPQPIKATR
jgi:hypothetical protein